MELPTRSYAIALLSIALILSFFAGPAAAKKTGQLTVFWGRHNYADGYLGEACDTGLYNTVIIAFHNAFGNGKFPNGLDINGHEKKKVGEDIKHCQDKGVLVLLSIGGDGHGYSLPTPKSAADVADYLWNAYLGGRSATVSRPFGDAVVDGIDFFIDNGSPDHYDELARRLAAYSRKGAGRKAVHLTATPKCAFWDNWHLRKALETGLFERLHVRFYGDGRCSYNQASLNGVVEQWNTWTTKFPSTKVYLGLAAAPNGPAWNRNGDMVPLKALHDDVLPKVQDAPNYGGIMLWDRSYDKETIYGASVKCWA